MKKSKILVALLLAFVMVFGVVALVACDGNKGDKPIELVLWAPSGAQTFYKEWAGKWAETYKDSQGRTYKVKLSVMEEGDAKSNLMNAPADGADVFLFVDDQVADLANAGILSPLGSGNIAQDVTARNTSGSIAAATYKTERDDEAQLYAYPMQADNTYYLFYNEEYFDAEDVLTWDALFAKLEQINTGKTGVFRKKVQFDYGTGWYAASWFLTFGGTATATETNFYDASVAYKAFQAAYEFSKHADIAFQSPDDAKQGLIDGDTIAAVAGSWIYSNPDEDTLTGVENNESVKLTTLPKVRLSDSEEYKQMISLISCKLIGVNAQCDYGVASHALANYLTSEEVQRAKALRLGAGPSNKAAADDEEIANLPTVKAASTQGQFAHQQNDLPVGFWDAVQNAIRAVKADAENVNDYFDAQGRPITSGTKGLHILRQKLEAEMFGNFED